MASERSVALGARFVHHEDVRLAIGRHPGVADLPRVVEALRSVMKIDPVPDAEGFSRRDLGVEPRRVQEHTSWCVTRPSLVRIKGSAHSGAGAGGVAEKVHTSFK
jgi:hypothetical protein